MVKIRPFRGYRYDEKRVDVSRAIFPPYELSNKQFTNIFLRISDYNIIRVILGNAAHGDKERYKTCARLLESWIRKGYLKKDDEPCIYVYSQEFAVNGKRTERTGFISLVELEKLGRNILPHELTFHDQIVDMEAILSCTRANLGPIFTLYSDPEKRIESILDKIKREVKPEFEVFTEYESVTHKLWAVKDPVIIRRIAEEMADKRLWIADGHHRYNISMEYSMKHPDDASTKFAALMMVNMNSDGMTILPTHRLVRGIDHFDRKDFMRALGLDFTIEVIKFNAASRKEKLKKMLDRINHQDWRSFGMYAGGDEFHILKLKNESSMDAAKNHSKPWKRFGINVLHVLVIKKILRIDAEKAAKRGRIEYVKDIFGNSGQCVERVRKGERQIAFFMRPAKIEDLKAISESGELMPQKSTCFYPKVYSGIVIYKFDNGKNNF